MKSVKTLVYLGLIALGLNSCNTGQSESIKQAVRFELQHYPEARLVDIYKNFFQNAFGPGHLIPDTSAARAYLKYELDNAVSFDSLICQPLGADHNYYRLNLVLLKNNTIPEDVFLNAFIRSANQADPPSIEEWKLEWKSILEVIKSVNPGIEGFARDKAFIDSLLSKDKYVVHHSKTYKSLYHPHYRIVHRDEYKKLKAYLVNKKGCR